MSEQRRGLGDVAEGVIACRDGRIVYAGEAAQAPADLDALERIDCDGRCVTPGLIDCHTHVIFAGNRVREFELRLAGASYEEISMAGGGIVSTVRATRDVSEDVLLASALSRVDRMIGEGVTTLEVKSGYGLSLADEAKMLRVARQLGQCRDIAVYATFLGAHAVPPEYAADADAYIELVCSAMIPMLAREGLCRSIDAFCEGIGFTAAQTRRVFQAAVDQGLSVKLHADQLSNQQGAALAAEFNALSADHLEYADEAGIRAMAAAGTVAVLLPGAYYLTRETRPPPLDLLRAHRVPLAIATDCNPGTSPLTSLLLAMNLAATCFRASVAECLVGVTREAARAVGLLQSCGTLEAGKQCDLAIWDIDSPAELVYWMGANPLYRRVRRGHA